MLNKKEEQLRFLIKKAHDLQNQIQQSRHDLRVKIRQGQTKAKQSGKSIGRPEKYSTNEMRGAVYQWVHKDGSYPKSIKEAARVNNVPYYALYYRIKRLEKSKKVSKC